MIVQHAISAGLLAVGLFFIVVGAVGFMRLPDAFCRFHVTGVLDTMGAPMVMLSAAVYLGPGLVSLKLVLGIIFLSLTSPLVGHLLARAALEAGHDPHVIDDPEREAEGDRMLKKEPERAGGVRA
jgi:multicomponent Na+:H+ antiporter subunit G